MELLGSSLSSMLNLYSVHLHVQLEVGLSCLKSCLYFYSL